MSLNLEQLGLVKTVHIVSYIEGLDLAQVLARDLFVEKIGFTMQEATDFVLQIGPRRSAELTEVLRGCTGSIVETMGRLYAWQPQRPH